MKSNKLTKVFIVLETILYLLIHLEIVAWGVGLRYVTIVLCFLFVLLFTRGLDSNLLKIAFFFTIVADFFLLVIDKYYIFGLLAFVFGQIIYAYRLLLNNPIQIKKRILFYIITIIFAELIFILIFRDKVDFLMVISLMYFMILLNNVINSFIFFKNNYLFALGLILFLLCDIFVGLYNIELYLDFTLFLKLDLAWIFYIPSQVLIALSAKTKHNLLKKEA